MEKVKVTKGIARQIENTKKKMKNHEIIERHQEIRSLDLDTLIRALYIGYEIEPEFNVEVGDWIKDTSTGALVEIINEQHRNNIMDERYTTKRHATPEEIKQEKERRWWAKHGREVWELKEGDVLKNKTNLNAVIVRKMDFWNNANSDLLRGKHQVLCFAENRLDLSN